MKIFLVTGGYDGSDYLDSTEIYDPDHGSWSDGAALPSPRSSLTATTIANRILLLGIDIYIDIVYCEHKVSKVKGYKLFIIIDILAGGDNGINDFDCILEYDSTDDSYTQIGTMTQARRSHAVAVVQYEDFSDWCE